MNIYVTDPLSDRRWDDLVARHPKASVFHQRGWLEALTRTYGYEPSVLTSSPAGEPLRDGLVLCRVSSWMTGTRVVSLPFADHCEPLLESTDDIQKYADWLRVECDRRRWKYFEIRPLPWVQSASHGLSPSCSYWFHELDTRPSLEQLFQGLHNNSFRRKIRRAEKERLSYETGHSEALVRDFYRLLLLTRRRHQLFPQPRIWFRNLVECMGDRVQIHLARKEEVPIAAMLTLGDHSQVVYKYGCSDERFHNLGAMPFLFWKLIEQSKASGAEKIDLGRSDLDNEGLVAFKDRLGATRKLMTYYRYSSPAGVRVTAWRPKRLGGLFSSLPDSVLSTVGRVFYRHIG